MFYIDLNFDRSLNNGNTHYYEILICFGVLVYHWQTYIMFFINISWSICPIFSYNALPIDKELWRSEDHWGEH